MPICDKVSTDFKTSSSVSKFDWIPLGVPQETILSEILKILKKIQKSIFSSDMTCLVISVKFQVISSHPIRLLKLIPDRQDFSL